MSYKAGDVVWLNKNKRKLFVLGVGWGGELALSHSMDAIVAANFCIADVKPVIRCYAVLGV